MSVRVMAIDADTDRAAEIRRINRLFHARTQAVFDREHRRRHRAERGFWEEVASHLTDVRRTAAATADRGLVVLDLACGTGFAGRVLARRLRGIDRLVALDLAEEAIGTVRKAWHCGLRPDGPRLIGAAGDAAALPLPDASVDLVAMNAALHHMPEPAAVLAEIDRVLRPGGLFALGFEPNAAHFRNPALRGLAAGLDRLAWYLDVGQNRRRLRGLLRRSGPQSPGDGADPSRGPADRPEAAGKKVLVEEDLPTELLELLDPHARGAGGKAGFDPHELLAHALRGYEVLLLRWSDYLGDAARRFPPLRSLADAAMGAIWPGQGVLFSWLVCKPLPGVRRQSAEPGSGVKNAGVRGY